MKCPYCSVKDLSLLNETNKNRHLSSCKSKNAPKRHNPFKQTTLSFAPKKFKGGCNDTTNDNDDILTTEIDDLVAFENKRDDLMLAEYGCMTVVESSARNDSGENEFDNTKCSNVDNNSDEKDDDTEVECEESAQSIGDPKTCVGFKPEIPNFYENFPFQLLTTLPNIILCGSSFHHLSCKEQSFYLTDQSSNFCNSLCGSLESDPKLKIILSRGNKTLRDVHPTTNNVYLTHTQLSEKAKQLHNEKNRLQLDFFSKVKKVGRLNAVLGMHQRIMVLLSQNDVPRAKELISVASKNYRSISYIVDKITDAIDGFYRAKSSENDRDLTFIVLKLGGPSLLDILCKANKLPSCSTAYRLAKQFKRMVCPVTLSVADCLENNIDVSTLASYACSLKFDETYLTRGLRYDARSDEISGVCYQHGSQLSLKFQKFENLEAVSQAIKDGQCHVPKECLVGGICRMDTKSKTQILLAWPTCSKNDYAGTYKIISSAAHKFQSLTGKPLMNICTDEDATRRIVVHNFMNSTVKETSPIHDTLNKIKLLDLQCGPGEETVSFDPKHLAKRCWCSAINGTMQINGITVHNEDLRHMLKLSEDNAIAIDNLLKPRDKQNVPNATKFLLLFIEAIRNVDSKSMSLPYRLISIKYELILLSYVYEAILFFYAYADSSITAQLKSFSIGAHCLLCLFRQNKGGLLPSQLVHDIQTTIQDAVFCCCKATVYFPHEPLYLVTNGTDPIERVFGIVRAKNSNCNLDYLDFIHCASALSQCDNLLINKHPDWSKRSHLSKRLCFDYSSVDNWDKDKLVTKDTDIAATWKIGNLVTSAIILEAGLNIDFDELAKKGITFKKPFGKPLV